MVKLRKNLVGAKFDRLTVVEQALGLYDDKEQALISRLKAEKTYYKEFSLQRHLFHQFNI